VAIENAANDDTNIQQMNPAQINMGPETSDELPKADEGWRTITTIGTNSDHDQHNKIRIHHDTGQATISQKKLAKSQHMS